MPTAQPITTAYLRQCFIEKDGRLWWRIRPRSHFDRSNEWKRFNKMYAGKEAGHVHVLGRGVERWMIGLQRLMMYRHVIVFALHRGIPTHDVDHENGNSLDDRISNLRPATRSQNTANTRRRRDNLSGYKGVSRRRKKWEARIRVRGEPICLGCFETPEDAHAAYVEAARKHFGEFANGG
jgi:hypothetical protein